MPGKVLENIIDEDRHFFCPSVYKQVQRRLKCHEIGVKRNVNKGL